MRSKKWIQRKGGCFSLYIEIRAAEGGDDAKLLVQDIFNIYQKWCIRNKWKIDITNITYGNIGWSKIEFIVSGENCDKFLNEAGGHRFQRIPETEKRGRVQTSTITVAALPIIENEFKINHKDLKWETTAGSTAGGQHAHKNETCVKLTHLPSNTSVACKDERSQKRNKDKALKVLSAKLSLINKEEDHSEKNNIRNDQIGRGQRGDKIRTYRFKDKIVKNHIKNKKGKLKDILRGKLETIQ